jgi:hypothetical protein
MGIAILILMLSACNNLTGPEAKRVSDGPIPKGMGMARIQLNAGESARTAVPGIGTYYFTLEFTAPGKTTVNGALSGGMSITVALEPAVWTLEVKGYADGSKTDLKLTGRVSVPITEGTASSFEVYLTPEFSSGGMGSLSYSIGFPAAARGAFALYPMDDTPGTSLEIDISGAGGTASGALTDLPEGSYRAAIDLYDGAANKAAAWTGAAHISAGSTTILTHTFSPSDFAVCGSLVAAGTNTLAAKLSTALASPSGTYTIALNGTETDLAAFAPKILNVTGGKNIAITIRGNGNEVQLGSNGSLFTLAADAGSSLSLALQDVTLRGRSDNDTALVYVGSRGTLEMKTGSLITGNTNPYVDGDSAYGYGGGVFLGGGTFSMSGGAVSGNTAFLGGGVHITYGGIFTMSGGAVSGNTASNGGGVFLGGGTFSMSGGAVSGNFAFVYGGGVSVLWGDTFSMSGGAVSGNSAAYGGGVSVNGETFTMYGGVVSGNTAYDGGGVLIEYGGIFTMSDGAVSGNTANLGGGVYVRTDGTFTMNGGTVSGNTATAEGGGVSVYEEGTFSMSGGTVSGNSASEAGGGVYVISGTFSMSGGAVSGNFTVGHGGGVYVGGGTFSMSGGAVSGNSATAEGGGVCIWHGTFTMNGGMVSGNSAAVGSGVYVGYTGGTFTMNGGAVSNNSATYGGGGVCVTADGTFSMNGGVVSNNSATYYGGGVYVSNDGTFSMNGGAVSSNSANSGGGVNVHGTFTMSGGAVSSNIADRGGGVCIWGGIFSMSGGVVSDNTAAEEGGGVCIWVGTFAMSEGAVSGNTAATGGGVYVNYMVTFSMSDGTVSGNILAGMNSYGREVVVSPYGTIIMSGDAKPERVSLDYDPFDNIYSFITISGPLSGGTVPIDLGISYGDSLTNWVGTQILQLASSYSEGDLASLKEKFTLGNASYTETPITGYRIDNNGFFVAE